MVAVLDLRAWMMNHRTRNDLYQQFLLGSRQPLLHAYDTIVLLIFCAVCLEFEAFLGLWQVNAVFCLLYLLRSITFEMLCCVC